MLTKRIETRNFISIGNRYIGPFEKEYNDFILIQIMKKHKSSHSILRILILFLSFILSLKVEPNEIILFDKRPNVNKIKWIIKNFSFFDVFIRTDAIFVIFINIFIISINIMKIREGSKRKKVRKTLIYKQEGTLRKTHFQCENCFSEQKNESKNTCELNCDETITIEHISIVINLDIEEQKYDTTNIIIFSHSSLKIKFQLGINKFNCINRCIYNKMITKNNSDKSFKSKFSEFIIYKIDILPKMKTNLLECKDYIIMNINSILNIFDNEYNLVYLLNIFNEIIYVNSIILITTDIYIIIIKLIKKNEEKIIYFIFIQNETFQYYLLSYVIEFSEIKNKMISNYKINKNDNINISLKNKGKRNLISNRKRNFIKIIKYIILLNLFNNIILNNKISLVEYKSYNITLKIKGTGTKKIFSSDTFYFKTEYYPNQVYINVNI